MNIYYVTVGVDLRVFSYSSVTIGIYCLSFEFITLNYSQAALSVAYSL